MTKRDESLVDNIHNLDYWMTCGGFVLVPGSAGVFSHSRPTVAIPNLRWLFKGWKLVRTSLRRGSTAVVEHNGLYLPIVRYENGRVRALGVPGRYGNDVWHERLVPALDIAMKRSQRPEDQKEYLGLIE